LSERRIVDTQIPSHLTFVDFLSFSPHGIAMPNAFILPLRFFFLSFFFRRLLSEVTKRI